MEEPDKEKITTKSFFSCKEYSKLCCLEMDCELSFYAKLAKRFHHILCFTCRRFSKQINIINEASKQLIDNDTHECKLSESTKNKIKSLMTD